VSPRVEKVLWLVAAGWLWAAMIDGLGVVLGAAP
jgi:hypothetical protein